MAMNSGIYGAISSENKSLGLIESGVLPEQAHFVDSEAESYALNGVCLNLLEIFGNEAPRAHDFRAVLMSPDRFEEMEGPVQGFHFDKQRCRLLLHTDFARQQPVYYYHSEAHFVFASSLADVVSILRGLNVPVKADVQAAAMLLTFASVLGEKTLVSGVKKLMPGHSLLYLDGRVQTNPRSSLLNVSRDITGLSDAVNMIDSSFQCATDRMVAVNELHGRAHVNLLSGGIDSRMVFLSMAKKTPDINCLCFSVEDYLDHQISRKIATDFGANYQFVNLNNGEYMCDMATVTQYDGSINYLASAHHKHALESANFSNAGLIASGQLGNEILAEFYMQDASADNVINSVMTMPGAHGYCHDAVQAAWSDAPESTVFKLLNKGFLYTNSAAYSTKPHGVLYSPFTSQEFVKNALRLHPDLLGKHRVYLEWMRSRFPDALRYKWERYRVKPVQGLVLEAAKIRMKVLARFIHPLTGFRYASMSPVQYWYDEMSQVQAFYRETFNEKRCQLDALPELADFVDRNFEDMSITNKASVLTLLSALEKYIHA
jgi:asparagine synthase (glutamine-hydrolysing)